MSKISPWWTLTSRTTNVCRITLELLLQHGFEPKRTIVLAVGFDEESAGIEVVLTTLATSICALILDKGAGHLARYLENFYGLNGFALLLDEGGM